jgi:hypothetical protein
MLRLPMQARHKDIPPFLLFEPGNEVNYGDEPPP